jgi:hypothetical protein
MQTFAVGSFLLCFVCMFLLFFQEKMPATWVFGGSLVLMIVSLGFSLVEIFSSAGALRMLLKYFEEKYKSDEA